MLNRVSAANSEVGIRLIIGVARLKENATLDQNSLYINLSSYSFPRDLIFKSFYDINFSLWKLLGLRFLTAM